LILIRIPVASAMEPQKSLFCLRDLLKTVLVNPHRDERMVRPIQQHILKNAKAFKGATREEQIQYLVKNVQGLGEQEAREILKIADEYPNRAPNARVVFGGSRVRGNATHQSDLDLGFFGFSRNQVNKIIKKINARKRQGVLPIPVETTKIYEMNETPFIPLIRSPEEFFMRAGEARTANGKLKDFTPSGFISIGMDGTVTHVPPLVTPGSKWVSGSRSGWGMRYEKDRLDDFNRIFIKKGFRYSESSAELQGPASLDRQLNEIVTDLDRRSPWAGEVREQVHHHHLREPTEEEMLKYYESRIGMYEDAILTIQRRLKGQNRELAAEFERYFDSEMKGLRKTHAKAKNEKHANLEQMDVRLSGVLGEIRAVVSVGQVREIGRRFLRSDVLGPSIVPRVEETAGHLASHPGSFETLSKKFPAVFKPPKLSPAEMVERLKDPAFQDSYLKEVEDRALNSKIDLERLRKELKSDPALFLKLHQGAKKTFPLVELPAERWTRFFSDPANRNAYLKEVRQFIESKEADLILDEGGGRYSWVEVKNNHVPLNSEGFRNGSFGKSAEMQLNENLQVLDYLGLRDRVRMKVLVNGMEPALEQELKTKGVEVLQAPRSH
jgi:predicted nucleotidyltransferase